MELIVATKLIQGVLIEKKTIHLDIYPFDVGSRSILKTIITSKGDLIAGSGLNTYDHVLVGSNGQFLQADDTQTLGMKWGTPSAYGTAVDITNTTATGTVTLIDANSYGQFINPNGAARDVALPGVASTNHPFFIGNSGATYSLTVKSGATILAVLGPGFGGVFFSNASVWACMGYKESRTKYLKGTDINPQANYSMRPQLFIAQYDVAITITRIHIQLSTNAQNIAADLKYADDMFTGVFANATIIDVVDTASGTINITSGFDHAAVPANKYIYLQFDAPPNVAITDILVQIDYTQDNIL